MANRSDISALTSTEIVKLLEYDYSPEIRQRQEQIMHKGKIRLLIAALQEATTAGARRALCYALGRRCSSLPVPTLIECLHDEDMNVRAEAAEALGNIGDPSAGPALFERFTTLAAKNTNEGNLLAYALGAVGYRQAIPALLDTLRKPSKSFLHGSVAIALGALGSVEAEDVLKEKLKENNSESDNVLFSRALTAVQQVGYALSTNDAHTSVEVLSQALNSSDPLLSESAAWALGLIGGPYAEAQLRRALTRQRTACSRTRRIREALSTIKTGSDLQK